MFSCCGQELNRTCKAMQQRVLELIPRVLNEQLTEELLIVNDNLNNIFLRHERYSSIRALLSPLPSQKQSSPVLPTDTRLPFFSFSPHPPIGSNGSGLGSQLR